MKWNKFLLTLEAFQRNFEEMLLEFCMKDRYIDFIYV